MLEFPPFVIEPSIMTVLLSLSCLVSIVIGCIVCVSLVKLKSGTKSSKPLKKRRSSDTSPRILWRFKCRLKYEIEFWLNTINALQNLGPNIRVSPILRFLSKSRVLMLILEYLNKRIVIPKCQSFITIKDSKIENSKSE